MTIRRTRGNEQSAALDIGLAIFRLTPAGGLERHAIRLARAMRSRGHQLTLYTTRSGALDEIDVVRLRRRGISNHARMEAFSRDVIRRACGRHDVLVGFQRMPGLDVLFCADWCFADRRLPSWKRLLPRIRTMLDLERACFGPSSGTRILALSRPQAEAYLRAYDLDPQRIIILGPTLDRRDIRTRIDGSERTALRERYGLAEHTVALLWVGLQPQLKGLDRAVHALAQSPHAELLVCGPEPRTRGMGKVLRLARKMGCLQRLHVRGMVPENEIRDLFQLCDILIHPSRLDVTGTVILEALGVGLPVITTDNCGYQEHVRKADAGVVLPASASADELARAIASASRQKLAIWSRNAQTYAASEDLTGGIEQAADFIERIGATVRPMGSSPTQLSSRAAGRSIASSSLGGPSSVQS